MQTEKPPKWQRMAESFYRRELDGASPTARRIIRALERVAPRYRPDSWRNLRNAIAKDQERRGYRDVADAVRQFRNPITADPGRRGEIKRKERRCKHVNIKDLERLTQTIRERNDVELLAAIYVAYLTGCRPAEMPTIEDLGSGRFYIHGAKKRDDRGLDRVIQLNGPNARTLSNCIPYLRGADMDKLRKRLYTVTRSLWPARKARPTLYSFRHMLGSELKASGMSRAEVAYVMGHRSTASVDVYGDRRRGGRRGRGVLPRAGLSEAEYKPKIRVNHEPPGPTKKTASEALRRRHRAISNQPRM